ncbi:MAG TPA: TetR/AcrR family transcriptional regulator [Amycolatopsis sp.]|jgi:AcrR family transcriptional regulator|nr:TetR/AcrR family transcriptional regulator [Amycolatopsis sp.]
MAGRRSDTRERIQRVALDLFAEQGYQKTSLREIAEKLDVTKAALYYHFKTKEDIISSLVEDLAASLDQVLEWARAQQDPVAARREFVCRIAALMEGNFTRLWLFIHENQPTLKEMHVSNAFEERMKAVFELICGGERDPAAQLKARLAVVALVLGNKPQVLAAADRSEVALRVALELASPHGGRAEAAT